MIIAIRELGWWARSRRNAWRHGLRSEALLFGSDGVPTDPELQSLYERVRDQYGRNRADTDELARSVVVEESRQRRAMQLEENCLQSVLDGPNAALSLEHLHRYRTTSRRALLKQLSQLHRPEQANPVARPRAEEFKSQAKTLF